MVMRVGLRPALVPLTVPPSPSQPPHLHVSRAVDPTLGDAETYRVSPEPPPPLNLGQERKQVLRKRNFMKDRLWSTAQLLWCIFFSFPVLVARLKNFLINKKQNTLIPGLQPLTGQQKNSCGRSGRKPRMKVKQESQSVWRRLGTRCTSN